MELNFSELDTMNPYQSTNNNNNNESREIQYNYWEKAPIKEQQNKKKKVSFNDILSNMNLVVNKQGVLQFMLPASNEINEINEIKYVISFDSFTSFISCMYLPPQGGGGK